MFIITLSPTERVSIRFTEREREFWQTRLMVCEGREGAGFPNGDVLIFPEMIKYR